jgi:hypothetical protein
MRKQKITASGDDKQKSVRIKIRVKIRNKIEN